MTEEQLKIILNRIDELEYQINELKPELAEFHVLDQFICKTSDIEALEKVVEYFEKYYKRKTKEELAKIERWK